MSLYPGFCLRYRKSYMIARGVQVMDRPHAAIQTTASTDSRNEVETYLQGRWLVLVAPAWMAGERT